MEQAKKANADNTKTINAIEKDNFIQLLNIPKNVYDAAICQINIEAPPEIMGKSSKLLPSMYTPGSYLNISSKPAEVYTINKGKERDTTFKIDTGGYVFSCFFLFRC